MREIILVDGFTFLFRAYHALGSQGGLTTASGQPTHAIYGVVNMLRGLLRECQPEYIAMVVDARGKTFRHELFAAYKATRPPMPADLRVQLDYVQQIVTAMGIAWVSVEGVEADDVIGTLATRASRQGFDTVIVSSDKDLAQLVNARVVVLDTMKNQRWDSAGVVAKFGVPPQQIVDYLALMGDTSDNIPGIPKVGPKTAAKWLGEFGSIDQLVEQADAIKGQVGESLRAHQGQLALARELTTIKCDVELPVTLDDLGLQAADTVALRRLYIELEFRAWLRQMDDSGGEVGGGGDGAVASTVAATYETILDAAALTRWLEKLKSVPIFALDTETTARDPHRASLVGLSFAVGPGEAAYLPLAHSYAGVPQQLDLRASLERLRAVLEDATIAKTGQNLKYDIAVLHYQGIEVKGITHDTMLMSYLLDAGNLRHDLDSLAMKYLNHKTITFSAVAGSGKKQLSFDQVALEQATPYAAEDADIALQLHQILAPKLAAAPVLTRVFTEIELPLMRVLATIERNGVKVDAQMLRQHSAELATSLREIEAQAYACAGQVFNIASPKQIREILYEKLDLKTKDEKKTSTGQMSTEESVLQELAVNNELPRLILQHRALAKLKTTYTDKLPELINPTSGRIHTSYHQAVAATGRLSSSEPNLQNIPIRREEGRRIRAAFIADEGNRLLAADYSQIELRIMAHLSEDAGLVAAFSQGLDVHRATAAEVFEVSPDSVNAEQRRRAKAVNFGLIYGMSAFGLARQLQIDQGEAKRYINTYFAHYPGVQAYMERTRALARDNGYVETLYGRRLNLPEINSKNALRRQYAERTAINAPMQGSAADLIKRAMLALQGWLEQHACASRIILQVHDELVLEVPHAELDEMQRIVPQLMGNVAELKVPLVVDTGVGDNWMQAH